MNPVRQFEKRRIERIREAIERDHGEHIARCICTKIELLEKYENDPCWHYENAIEKGDHEHADAIYDECVEAGLWEERRSSVPRSEFE